MHRDPDRQNIPVWQCPQRDPCGAFWVTREADTTCPFCHVGRGQPAGFTWGDLARAAEEVDFDGELPVLLPVPVPELVQLTTLPPELWVGLPVFHPCGQDQTHANWLLYDVGVCTRLVPPSSTASTVAESLSTLRCHRIWPLPEARTRYPFFS